MDFILAFLMFISELLLAGAIEILSSDSPVLDDELESISSVDEDKS